MAAGFTLKDPNTEAPILPTLTASAQAAVESHVDDYLTANPPAGDVSALIDDTAGDGITNRAWSADKLVDELAAAAPVALTGRMDTAEADIVTVGSRVAVLESYLDVVSAFGLVEGQGIDPADRTANKAGFIAALEAAETFGVSGFTDGRLNKVFIRPGIYETDGEILWEKSGDGVMGWVLEGDNPVTTVINNVGTTEPVLNINNTGSGNLRWGSVRNVMLRGGSVGLRTNKVKYSTFEHVHFFQNQLVAHEIEYGGFNRYEGFSYIECFGDTVTQFGGSADTWISPKVGEGGGNWMIQDAIAILVDPNIHGSWDRLNLARDARDAASTGYGGMGPAVFTVKAGGGLIINGGWIACSENFLNLQHPRLIKISGTVIDWDWTTNIARDGHILNFDSNSQGGTVELERVEILIRKDSAVTLARGSILDTRPVERCRITGHCRIDDAGGSLLVDDDMTEAGRHNHLDMEVTFT